MMIEILSEISDNRRASQIKYAQHQIIAIVIIAVMADIKHVLHIEYFCKAHLNWFKKTLGLNSTPSDTTICRVLSSMSFKELEAALVLWVECLFADKHIRKRLIVDGKKVVDGVTLVRAMLESIKLVCSSVRIHKYQSEIKAIPKVLRKIYLKGYLVSIDAIGTQVKIADLIVSKNANYLLPVKRNQKTLYNDLKLFAKSEIADQSGHYTAFETHDYGHGRHETRRCYVFLDVNWLHQRHPNWSHIKSFALLKSSRKVIGQRLVTTYRIYISSARLTAKTFLHEIRAHWKIENCLHYPLNQAFGEKKILLKNFNAISNMSLILNTAVSIFTNFKPPKISFNLQKKMFSWNLEHFKKLLCLEA